MRRLVLVLGLLFPSLVFAQGGAITTSGIVAVNALGRPVGGATVTICAYGAAGIPCSPTITVYTDPTLGTPATNPATADGNGNVFRYANPGRYTITVTGTGITGTSFTATVAGSGGGDVIAGGANGFTGNNTHSGTETFANTTTVGKWNSILTVDGTQFTTCDSAVAAAVTQAGSGLALVIVPSTYAGAACTTIPTNNHVQVWYFNNIDPLVQSGIFWNTTSATPVNAWFRPQVNFTNPPGNALSVYAIARFSGVIPGNSAMDAVSSEAQSVGAITSVAAGTKLQGLEDVVTLASTGSTWPDIRASVFYVQDIPTNTTNATNTSAIFVPTMAKTGSGNYGTLVGAIFNKQTAGNVANWAMQSFGSSLFAFNAANEKLFISGDSFSNSNVIDIADTHAGGHTWDIGEMQNVTHLSFRDITQTGGPAWSFLLTGTANVEGILSNANTANRTYTFPDATGTVSLLSLAQTWTANQTINAGNALIFAEGAATSGSGGNDVLWGDSADHMVHFNANNGSVQNVNVSAFVTSAYTNATTTFSTVTNMSFPVAASRNYAMACHLYLQGSATTAGPKFQLTGPASPTAVLLAVGPFDPIAKTTTNVVSGFSTPNTTLGTIGALAINYDVLVTAGIVNGVNAGTVVLQAAANGAGTLTIQPGSWCEFK